MIFIFYREDFAAKAALIWNNSLEREREKKDELEESYSPLTLRRVVRISQEYLWQKYY
jgi:hypothetical protein